MLRGLILLATAVQIAACVTASEIQPIGNGPTVNSYSA